MKLGQVRRRGARKRTLGLKIHTNAVGWALLENQVRPPRFKRETGVDPLQRMFQLIEAHPEQRPALYVYGDAASYHGSAGHRDGLTREEHRRQVEAMAEELSRRGIDVEIVEIRSQ